MARNVEVIDLIYLLVLVHLVSFTKCDYIFGQSLG